MTNHIERLASVGGQPIGEEPPEPKKLSLEFGQEHATSLVSLLGIKNGFYAFESALHIYSTKSGGQEHNIIKWNSTELWRNEYGKLTEGCVFFAEDVFGNQFCLKDNSLYVFDAETGELEPFAASLDDWAGKILADYSLWTGHKLAHEWQQLHGPLPIGSRLLPKIPFVMGGDFVVTNLYDVEAAKGMRFRACIATQIHDLPDGSAVTLSIAK